LPRRLPLPPRSIIRDCAAIGYSASGVESWIPGTSPVEVLAIGIPAYPGSIAPRVVGLLRPTEFASKAISTISYVHGSAIEPRGSGERLVVQVVNDETSNWGGAGFASAVRKAWPEVQADFRAWVNRDRDNLTLGRPHLTPVGEQLAVASVVAQHGYGPSLKPRLRYSALRSGLAEVAALAKAKQATVHMPRIGTGHAGGSWPIIEEIIFETMGNALVGVTVYDLPGTTPKMDAQTSLALSSAGTR